MKRHICVSFAAIVLFAFFLLPSSRAQQNESNSSAVELQDLLQQRHDTLERRYEAIKRQYDDRAITYEHVLAALDDVLRAKDALYQAKFPPDALTQERLALCKLRIGNFRYLEELRDAQVKAGSVPVEDGYAATAARIQAEIDYLRIESGSD